MSLTDQIGKLRLDFLQELNTVSHSKDLEQLKVKYLGKKGPVQSLMQELRHCSAEERPHFGKMINDLKEELSSHCAHSIARLQAEELESRLTSERIDTTLPGRRRFLGSAHPVTQMLNRALEILSGMGFSIQLGPDVDTDYYNFGGLNFAPDHPARDMQDTFYITPEMLLRTHTSNVQVHTLERHQPPIRVVAPGRCFRNETISARSHVFFHQIEGFYIDTHVTFTDLFATLETFWSALLGQKAEMRYRPSYFPFVEPGLEVDVRCTSCGGSGCRVCKQTGWLEVCGAGMIHPHVLQKGNIDPDRYTGFAWGMGIERPAMLLHNIPDIRLFTENDLRFLDQFSTGALYTETT